MRVMTIIVGIAILGMLVLLGGNFANHASGGKAPAVAMSVVPTGITLNSGKNAATLADAKGMTIYVYDKDEPGKSNCTGDCIATWPAVVATTDIKSDPYWSVIARPDGVKQLAFRGKPLYTYSKDNKPGDLHGFNFGGVWHVAANDVAAGDEVPDGVSIAELANAGGVALIGLSDRTLYSFDGDAKSDAPACPKDQPKDAPACVNHWEPLRAAELANPIGKFTVVSRADGSRQWAYGGHPLYMYDGDNLKGDANGRAVDSQHHVALIEQFFTPPGITVRHTGIGVDVLADAKGMTLYTRDRFTYSVGGHNIPTDNKLNPSLGRELGTAVCDAECTKTWIPLKAPADAQASGYYSVATREDGTKQWAYQGYPLYTYTGDRKPGDLTGNDEFDLTTPLAPPKSALFGPPALWWRSVLP